MPLVYWLPAYYFHFVSAVIYYTISDWFRHYWSSLLLRASAIIIRCRFIYCWLPFHWCRLILFHYFDYLRHAYYRFDYFHYFILPLMPLYAFPFRLISLIRFLFSFIFFRLRWHLYLYAISFVTLSYVFFITRLYARHCYHLMIDALPIFSISLFSFNIVLYF